MKHIVGHKIEVMRLAVLGFCLAASIAPLLHAQTPCTDPKTYQPCDLVFELTAEELKAHPDPFATLTLYAEVKSPRFKTFLLHAFWDGGTRFVIRFSPTEAGTWEWRLTSSLGRFDKKTGKVEASDSDSLGFIKAANIHHWQYTENLKPHLWMGDTQYRFAFIDRAVFEQIATARAAQKFNHVRGLLFSLRPEDPKPFATADQPNLAFLKELDHRLAFLNNKGIIVDLILGADQNQLADFLPTYQARERFIRYIVSRYSAYNLTWQLVQEFEEYKDGRAFCKQMGELLKKHDPYSHPRSTHALVTSAPLAGDGWMTHRLYQSSSIEVGAIEHQMANTPGVNAEFAYEDSGAGKSHPHHVDAETFRRRLWNMTMNGQYPTFGNTGTYGGRKFEVAARYTESTAAKVMTTWFEFFANTRYWELEPYFNVDGGRALALERIFRHGEDAEESEEEREGIEYVVYVEKPRLIEVQVAKHGYQVYWFNPRTGEKIKGKDWKGDKFVGEPPTKEGDWVLHLSRDGRKERMLRSYKFDSRPVPLYDIEANTSRVPFALSQPTGDTISMAKPPKFEVKLTRQARSTRTMFYLWTAEVAADGQGYRVIGIGESGGALSFPKDMIKNFPGVMNLRVAGMNANGKVYALDKVFRLAP